jgi:FAD/FMN-containing dehydrogenase
VQAAQAAVKRFHVRLRLPHSLAETANYWAIRRESFNLLRHGAKNNDVTVPFIDDIIVRPEYLPEFLPRLSAIMHEHKLHYTIAGHVGDGNFHIIPLMDTKSPDFLTTFEAVADKVSDLVLEFKGSLTAEHNDGLIRSHYLKKMFGENIFNLFVETKKIFDPKNIFNPGKKINADWEFAKQHIARQ